MKGFIKYFVISMFFVVPMLSAQNIAAVDCTLVATSANQALITAACLQKCDKEFQNILSIERFVSEKIIPNISAESVNLSFCDLANLKRLCSKEGEMGIMTFVGLKLEVGASLRDIDEKMLTTTNEEQIRKMNETKEILEYIHKTACPS
jgi:hypothetical protein